MSVRTVRVVDQLTGAPVGGMKVRVLKSIMSPSMVSQQTTDSKGIALIDLLPGNVIQVQPGTNTSYFPALAPVLYTDAMIIAVKVMRAVAAGVDPFTGKPVTVPGVITTVASSRATYIIGAAVAIAAILIIGKNSR